MILTGTVYEGSNNIFKVKDEFNNLYYTCRIKGKTLKGKKSEYNAITVGDLVEFETDEFQDSEGMILDRLERKNYFCRLNRKRNTPQFIAANIDSLLILTSPDQPPFRPRFIDRVLAAVNEGGVSPVIVMNKIDQGVSEDVQNRFNLYKQLGFDTVSCSAISGEGIENVKKLIKDKTIVLFGQSGVGKSTLLNAIEEGLNLRTSEISQKYNRGRHTTTSSVMVECEQGGRIIDTPGIREFFPAFIEADQLAFYYPEMSDLIGDCGFTPCSHLHEPKCAILKALEDGEINRDRYHSYEKLYSDLNELNKKY